MIGGQQGIGQDLERSCWFSHEGSPVRDRRHSKEATADTRVRPERSLLGQWALSQTQEMGLGNW